MTDNSTKSHLNFRIENYGEFFKYIYYFIIIIVISVLNQEWSEVEINSQSVAVAGPIAQWMGTG